MKVLHIITGLEVGGAERALHVLLTGGLQDDFDNRVISLTGPGHYGPLLAAAGIGLTSLGMARGLPHPGAVLKLRRAIRQDPPDLVQGWMYHGNLAASLARRLVSRRTPLVWNIRTSREADGTAKASTDLVMRLGARLSSGPAAILYNAQRSRDQHEAEGYAAAHGHVIANGFDTAIWRPDPGARARLSGEFGLPGTGRLIGFVARAHPEKDPQNLFEAFSRIATNDCHLVCVGGDLEAAAPDHLDRSRVTFLGQRPNIARIMPGFDLFCLTSQVEGFPNVLGEAMACGVPCVSTDVGDAALLLGGTGWVVPPRDPAALAQALATALSCPVAELIARGEAARARIAVHYSLKANVAAYRKLYNTLLEVH